MKFRIYFFALVLLPGLLEAQTQTDSLSLKKNLHRYTLMVNASAALYTRRDAKINNFLSRYGYTPPQQFPVGFRMEAFLMPQHSPYVFGINAATVVSRQDIITANFSLGVYRKLYASKHLWVMAGFALGENFDRVVLDKGLPPSFDSLEIQYGKTLSLHRTAVLVEPGAKILWYPLRARKFQLGPFATLGADAFFNTRWRLGYYPQDSNMFKRLRRPADVNTTPEIAGLFSGGLSACF